MACLCFSAGSRTRSRLLSGLFIACAWLSSTPAFALQLAEHDKIRALIDEMVAEHGYDAGYLQSLFARVDLQPEVIVAITRPAERLPWYRYKKIFLNEARIENGIDFWTRYKSVLRRAELEFGVPAAIIVAIIGVETNYGRVPGKYSVIESLTTLSLQYPQRSGFFTSELKNFLLLARDEQLPPLTVKGSYAGAIGIPQFIPSSYSAYSVDFSQNGARDLVLEVEDAIGSVANYLHVHNWVENGPIASDVDVSGAHVDELIATGLSTASSVEALTRAGVKVEGNYPGATRVNLIRLHQDEQSYQYRAVFDNFYVITRYNTSVLYAMAVRELGLAIARKMRNWRMNTGVGG